MKSLFGLIWVFCLASYVAILSTGCTPATAEQKNDSAYQWHKLADTSAWSKSYNFQMMTIQDTLWVFHQDGNWFSTDGRSWTKSLLPNAIGNLAFLDYVFFQNKIFGLGHFEGNADEHTLRPTIYFSSDRIHWDSTTNTNLQKRYFYHPFVFDGKIWIIGGEQDSNIWSDIINSFDGIHWQIMKDKLPFGPVVNSQFLLYKNKIWMFSDDVWSSADGYEWTEVAKEILPGQKIVGYAAVVYDEKMWLIGCNRSGEVNSQVLYSEDGIHWTGQTAPWTPRGGAAVSVIQDKIIMTGGKYGGTPGHPEFGYSNDVWEMAPSTARSIPLKMDH
jgi:hypothetical protein